MKKVGLFVTVLLVVAAVAGAQEAYDSDAVVAIMRSHYTAFAELRDAASSGNFLEAAGALATLAEGSYEMIGFRPPRGSAETWRRINEEMLLAALDGIAACSREDRRALDRVVRRIDGLSNEGHGNFL